MVWSGREKGGRTTRIIKINIVGNLSEISCEIRYGDSQTKRSASIMARELWIGKGRLALTRGEELYVRGGAV